MSEYVSKEELKEFFESIEITVAGRTRAEAIGEVLQAIYNGVMELPTTDAVQVIRCKDCKWYEFDVPHRCGYTGLNGYIAEDNFCSKAEPKEKKDDR